MYLHMTPRPVIREQVPNTVYRVLETPKKRHET